jgi:hypothetical protein
MRAVEDGSVRTTRPCTILIFPVRRRPRWWERLLYRVGYGRPSPKGLS